MPIIYSPRSQCEGKVPYRSRAEAKTAVKTGEQRWGVRLRHYRCVHCNWWHIGNRVHPQNRPAA